VVDDAADGLIVELTGSEAFVLSCLRALERFEIVEVARSGTIALATANNLQTETMT
jgi:acetolactate synthase small subunit